MNVSQVAVIGAGTMGNGIAQICAQSGINVTMIDVSEDVARRGLETLSGSLDRLVKKEKISAQDKDDIVSRIKPSASYEDIRGAELIIEAATEKEDLKLKILKQIDELLDANAVIATNTSSISITKLATSVADPGRFVGMHFFNPVPVMKLVELIRGLQTTDETHKLAQAFVEKIGKEPISVKNSPGFVVNRILCPMMNEAIFAYQEGLASAEEIDTGMKLGSNQPIGPLALADLVGLDTLLSVMEVFYDGFKDPKYRPAPLLQEMVDAGFLGRKSGRGFYDYG
ncbi:3-hydroxybutyryl-CoA dehydrogenase [Ectothiorhodospiraceae bacterium WFHF3C12]|nr:3-hydroxybutyryl-CoA dehydrogenase [Ectothiorhodospiraceae bacterium WFHF3C12]